MGTSSNGAVLYTASGAALRGMNVIIPVDGISAVDPYAGIQHRFYLHERTVGVGQDDIDEK